MAQEQIWQYILDELKSNNEILRDNGLKLESLISTTTEHKTRIEKIEEKLETNSFKFFAPLRKFGLPVILAVLLVFVGGRISVTGYSTEPQQIVKDGTNVSSTLIAPTKYAKDMKINENILKLIKGNLSRD